MRAVVTTDCDIFMSAVDVVHFWFTKCEEISFSLTHATSSCVCNYIAIRILQCLISYLHYT
jgi:hypothetical protein